QYFRRRADRAPATGRAAGAALPETDCRTSRQVARQRQRRRCSAGEQIIPITLAQAGRAFATRSRCRRNATGGESYQAPKVPSFSPMRTGLSAASDELKLALPSGNSRMAVEPR